MSLILLASMGDVTLESNFDVLFGFPFLFGLYCLGRNLLDIIPDEFLVVSERDAATFEDRLALVEERTPVPFRDTTEAAPSFAFSSGVFGDDLLLFFTLFLDLMTSLFREMGLGRPWSFKNNPHALQSTCPVSSLLHKGVVCVLQFLHVGVDRFCFVVVAPLDWVVVVVLALGTACGF